MTLAAGARFGPYEIRDLIGHGGMGEVYRAHDPRLGREVAIKVLSPHLAEDAESIARFRREARAIAAISHPNIIAIFDVGDDFVVTELLEGEMLRTRLDRGPLARDEMLRIGGAVADGLAAAHAKGVIHRDLKPENIFLTSDGGVKILDFGLAAIVHPMDGLETSITEPGMVVGTIGYMSPEQLSGKPLTAATDVFSFGCLAYEMLQRERPFSGDSSIETIASILRDDPFARAPDVAPDLRAFLGRCLAKHPDDRFQNGAELRAALREVVAARAPTLRFSATLPRFNRRRAIGVGVALIVVVVAAIVIANVVRERRRIIDDGYQLRAGDVTGDSETRRLTALALRADAAGDRSAAIEFLREAARRDPHTPLPAAFLSSWTYYSGDHAEGQRWAAETNRRLGGATSTYESLLSRYLAPDLSTASSRALASSLLELRPKAWRLRLSLAHRAMERREMEAMLAHLKQIDVSSLDDRRAALVIADRASIGDVAGAERELAHSRLATHPPLLAYTRGRIAWSKGRPADAARLFDEAAEGATLQNFVPVAMESRVLGGIARAGAGDLAGAASAFDVAAFKAQQLGATENAVDAYGFGGYLAWRRSDQAGAERRLRDAASLVDPHTEAAAALRLLALRCRVEIPPSAGPTSIDPAVATLIHAREAWARSDAASASRLLEQSRSEGIETTWFAEEAALLAADLGAPARKFKADPPYPVRLRFVAVWELER